MIKKIKKYLILYSILSLIFQTIFFIVGLVLFILSIKNKIQLHYAISITIYAISILSLPFVIVISVFSLVSITNNRTITSFRKTINILKWFVILNVFTQILVFKYSKSIDYIQKNKPENYLVISFSEMKKMMWNILYSQSK